MIEIESPRYIPPTYTIPEMTEYNIPKMPVFEMQKIEMPTGIVAPTYETPASVMAGAPVGIAEPVSYDPISDTPVIEIGSQAYQPPITPEFKTQEAAIAEAPIVDVAARIAEKELVSEVYQPPTMDVPTQEEALAEIEAQQYVMPEFKTQEAAIAEIDARTAKYTPLMAVHRPELGTRLKVQREEEKKPQSQIRTNIKARREEFIKRIEELIASHEGEPEFERLAVFLRRFIEFLKSRGVDIKITNESEIRNRSPGEHISAKFQIKNRRSDRDLNVRVKATDQEGRTIREIEVPDLKRNEARIIELGFIVPAKIGKDYSPVRFEVSEIFEEVM